MAADSKPDRSILVPLSSKFVNTATHQLALIMGLCRELGYEDGWLSNIVRRPLWRNAILYHRKYKKFFDKLFPTAGEFRKSEGITFVNLCLIDAGVNQEMQGGINNAYFSCRE